MAGDDNHELEGKEANISFKCKRSDLKSEMLSARGKLGGRSGEKNGSWVFNDFLHIRIICHFN